MPSTFLSSFSSNAKIKISSSFDFFYETCVYLLPQQKVWIDSCHSSFVLNFGAAARKNLPVLVNRIFPTLLAAWSRQQYPCTWVKLSFTVLISQSDKKKEYFKFYFDRSILHPDGVDSSVAFLGAIRLALIAWPPKYDNICIKMFLMTSVYSILSYYSLLSEFLLTQKTCVIYSSLLVVFIPWRSLSKRRNLSEINEKADNYKKSSFALLTSLR